MMASLARLVGKAAAGAAPVMLQKWRDDVARMEAERQREFQAEQGQLGRDQQAQQFDKTMAMNQEQMDNSRQNSDRQLGIAEENLALNRQQQQKLIQKMDQEIETGEFSLRQARQLQTIRDQIESADAADTDMLQGLVQKYNALTGKEPTADFTFMTVDNPDLSQTVYKGNKRTGEFGPAEKPEKLIPDAEDIKMLNDNPERMRSLFEEAFGVKADDFIQKTETPVAAQPSADRARIQDTDIQPSLATRAATTKPDDSALAGFTDPMTDTAGQRMKRANEGAATLMQQVTAGSQQAQQSNAVNEIKAIMDKGELPKLSRPFMRNKIRRAIESGQLPPEYTSALEAYLQKYE
jgi:hypothetical protein